jgi:peptidoglycan/LPS O-acetylase OafA/YrhL
MRYVPAPSKEVTRPPRISIIMGNIFGVSRTLGTAFDRRTNSLNAIRLGLAALVVVSHSWAIGGFGEEPELGGAHLGTWAVLGFFAISGYLITASRLNSTAGRYYRARVLRIMPAFIVCLLVIAAVFAPLSTLVHGSWSGASAASYVLHNIALYPPHFAQDGITDTLGSVSYERMWDGSLWTLFWEASCYVLVGVGVSVLPRGAVLPTVGAGFIAATAVGAAGGIGLLTLPGIGDRVVPLVATFLAGALVFLLAERLSVSAITIVIALVWLGIAILLGLVQQLGGLPIAFLLLVLGSRREAAAVGRRFDASYGFYIYAWPVQQLVVLLLHGRGGVWLVVLLSLIVTTPLAYLSCIVIERPALRLAHRSPSKVPQVAPVP